jgi:hypothetical protein
MKSLRKISTLLFLSVSCLLLFSCSKDLSRDKAKDLIIKTNGFPTYETAKINKEYLKLWECLYKMRDWEGGFIGCGAFPENLTNFQNSGLIVIGQKNIEGINGWTGTLQSWVVYTVTLTDEGKKYLVSESDKEIEFKTCELDFGEITGVQTQTQVKAATANYTIIRKATPFGFNVPQGTENRTANFSLFDDGWRIN